MTFLALVNTTAPTLRSKKSLCSKIIDKLLNKGLQRRAGCRSYTCL